MGIGEWEILNFEWGIWNFELIYFGETWGLGILNFDYD